MSERTKSFNTLCRDCIFSQWNELEELQVGCELDRLQKYIDRNQAKLIKDKETDVSYYNIDTICNTCRDSNSRYFDAATEVKKEVEISCDFIILCDSNREDWEEQILKTAELFINHNILPTKVVFGFYQKRILFHSFNQKVQKIFKDKDIQYDIVNVLEYVYDSWKLVDILAKKCKSQYFTLCEIDGTLPENWISNINKYINEDLYQLSMLRPINGLTGLTIQTLLYKTLNGSEGNNIIDKVEYLANEQNKLNMIKDWYEL